MDTAFIDSIQEQITNIPFEISTIHNNTSHLQSFLIPGDDGCQPSALNIYFEKKLFQSVCSLYSTNQHLIGRVKQSRSENEIYYKVLTNEIVFNGEIYTLNLMPSKKLIYFASLFSTTNC